jgi:protein NUD1
LTECSFGVAHDRLVQVITDVQPFEPHWEALAAIELNGRSLESVARLKEFLPKLDSLSLYVPFYSEKLCANSWYIGITTRLRT